MFTNLAILGASHCGDLPDLNIARSRFGGQLGHILPDTCPSQLSALSNDFFLGKFINMGIQPWMEIQLSVFFGWGNSMKCGIYETYTNNGHTKRLMKFNGLV